MIILRTERVRPDLDHSAIRVIASIDGEDRAEATYTPPRTADHIRGQHDPEISYPGSSDKSIERARAQLAAIQGALNLADSEPGHTPKDPQ